MTSFDDELIHYKKNIELTDFNNFGDAFHIIKSSYWFFLSQDELKIAKTKLLTLISSQYNKIPEEYILSFMEKLPYEKISQNALNFLIDLSVSKQKIFILPYNIDYSQFNVSYEKFKQYILLLNKLNPDELFNTYHSALIDKNIKNQIIDIYKQEFIHTKTTPSEQFDSLISKIDLALFLNNSNISNKYKYEICSKNKDSFLYSELFFYFTQNEPSDELIEIFSPIIINGFIDIINTTYEKDSYKILNHSNHKIHKKIAEIISNDPEERVLKVLTKIKINKKIASYHDYYKYKMNLFQSIVFTNDKNSFAYLLAANNFKFFQLLNQDITKQDVYYDKKIKFLEFLLENYDLESSFSDIDNIDYIFFKQQSKLKYDQLEMVCGLFLKSNKDLTNEKQTYKAEFIKNLNYSIIHKYIKKTKDLLRDSNLAFMEKLLLTKKIEKNIPQNNDNFVKKNKI